MADFCRQCSIEIFGRDREDMRPCGDPECDLCMSEDRAVVVVVCEGCGFTRVDDAGSCLYHEANGGTAGTCFNRGGENSNKKLEQLWDAQ